MKLYIVTGKKNGRLGFAYRTRGMPMLGCAEPSVEEEWLMSAFPSAEQATNMLDEMSFGVARHCKVVEIEIPDDDA